MEREGFVDEAVVLALINGPRQLRSAACHEDLALAADDLDFAGWQLPNNPPARVAETPLRVTPAISRRATPPVLVESGIGEPHHGAHRWWLAGLAGAFSTMLFSLLLLTLSSRPPVSLDPAHAPVWVTRVKPVQPLTEPREKPAPALTDASTQRP
jgi:hypothetical protein